MITTDQTISETIPYTFSGETRTGCGSDGLNTVCTVYSGLVPISPKTTPKAPSSRANRPVPCLITPHALACPAGDVDARPPAGTMYCVTERTMGNPIVIIGGGLAGGNAAATLREEGFTGPVVLISREPGIPFGRPPLSKTYLRSEEDLDGWYVRPAGWYTDHDVELRSGAAVVAVDPATHRLTLDSGEELGYQKVLI